MNTKEPGKTIQTLNKMALIDKEQLKTEIERRLSNIVTGLDFTAEIELKGLLSFLDSVPPIQSLNRDHVARIIELWQDVEHDIEWCNEPSEFMYDEVLRRFNLDTLPEQPKVDLEKVYDSYCKVCGHYHHTTPDFICRQACDYFKDFKALLNAKKEE